MGVRPPATESVVHVVSSPHGAADARAHRSARAGRLLKAAAAPMRAHALVLNELQAANALKHGGEITVPEFCRRLQAEPASGSRAPPKTDSALSVCLPPNSESPSSPRRRRIRLRWTADPGKRQSRTVKPSRAPADSSGSTSGRFISACAHCKVPAALCVLVCAWPEVPGFVWGTAASAVCGEQGERRGRCCSAPSAEASASWRMRAPDRPRPVPVVAGPGGLCAPPPV